MPGTTTTPQPAPRTARSLRPAWLDDGRLQRMRQQITLVPEPHETIDVVVPFTGEVLGWIPHGTEPDVELAVRRARAAQKEWAKRPVGERAGVFLRFHDLMIERQDEVLDLVQLEAGKARRDAFEEALDTVIVSRYYAMRAADYLRPRRRKGALPGLTLAWEYHHPVGVVGFISPWNYPLNLPVTDAVPALLAGNTAVLRPDPQTSYTTLWALELLREAGLPTDVLHLVTGPGAELGPPLIGRVDYVMFTGSTRTGKIIADQAAARLLGYSLELGGKNPMLVLEDADVDAAAAGAVRGAFVGAGQVCVSIERIYAHESVYERFAEAFVGKTRQLKLGPALDYSMEMGSLTSQRQLDTVTAHVRDALSQGARLLAGGLHRPDLGPFFYEPTILSGVREGMLAHAEETFGPVVALYPVRSVEEAVARANDTRYGLNASVWTRNERRGRQVATRIRAGSVNVNETYAATWASVDAPIGGMKESGVSRRHGREGILKYTEPQTVAVQRLLPVSAPRGVPQDAYSAFMNFGMKWLRHIPGLR